MKLISLLIILSLLACTNHKAQNTNSEPQDSIQSQQSRDFSQQTSDNNEKTDKDSLLIPHFIAKGSKTFGSSFLINIWHRPHGCHYERTQPSHHTTHAGAPITITIHPRNGNHDIICLIRPTCPQLHIQPNQRKPLKKYTNSKLLP